MVPGVYDVRGATPGAASTMAPWAVANPTVVGDFTPDPTACPSSLGSVTNSRATFTGPMVNADIPTPPYLTVLSWAPVTIDGVPVGVDIASIDIFTSSLLETDVG